MVEIRRGHSYDHSRWWVSIHINGCMYRYGPGITPGSSITLRDGNRIRRDIRI